MRSDALKITFDDVMLALARDLRSPVRFCTVVKRAGTFEDDFVDRAFFAEHKKVVLVIIAAELACARSAGVYRASGRRTSKSHTLPKGRTTIVIAHRLSTIKNADLIVAVDDGSVVEVGTHNQLMDNENLYYELVTAQSLGVDEAIVAGGVGRAISRRYRKRSESGASFHRKASVHRQQSEEGFQHQPSFKKQLTQKQLSKLQEEWDKDTPKVSILRVIKLNAREWWIILIGVIGAAVNGCIWPAFGFLFGEILEVFALPPDQILDEIHVWAGLFIVLGVVSGVGVFLKAACFAVSGENLTARLRSLSFRAMLRQEIGWHDDKKNSTGALTTRLANDASQVQGATGTRLGTLIETAFGLSFALLIALVYSWILTFVILAAVPILIISGLAEATILTGHTKKNKEAIESAGKIAVDSVDNIRTVASLGLESTFYSHYMGEIKRPYRRGIINSSVYGLTYAFSQATLYFMYAAIFRFGAYQVTRPNDDIAHESFEDIFRVFTALIFGAIAVGQAGAFAPNYTKARLSSNRIFQLLDRVPLIDGYSVDGETPDDTTGAVETENLQFKYPTRPDVFVLNGLKLSISPGKTLALVGPSGCGKSTIVSLLERFYDPSKGKMMLDGRDLRDLNIRWLRSQVGIVSQEPVLFDTSIAENISVHRRRWTGNIRKFLSKPWSSKTVPSQYRSRLPQSSQKPARQKRTVKKRRNSPSQALRTSFACSAMPHRWTAYSWPSGPSLASSTASPSLSSCSCLANSSTSTSTKSRPRLWPTVSTYRLTPATTFSSQTPVSFCRVESTPPSSMEPLSI
jgi:ABC-type multidrug transport system fused ATPase/permease subunit